MALIQYQKISVAVERGWMAREDAVRLIAGALAASLYFTADNTEESELRELVDFLYRRIVWPWAQNGDGALVQGWKPECGFQLNGWDGYSEALVL